MKKKITAVVWECVCDVCEHTWTTRTGRIPKVCAKCTNPNWDRKSEKEVGENPVDAGEAGSAWISVSEPKEEVKELEYDSNPMDFDLNN